MNKSGFFYLWHIAVMLLLCLVLFTACENPSNNETTGKTWIEFKNLEEYPVTIYTDSGRQTVFAEIPANGTKKVSAEPAPMGIAFYPTYQLMYPIETAGAITIPYNGEAIIAAIFADQTNTVPIPKQSITINSAYIMLINNSNFSLTLRKGSSELSPLGGGSSVINSNKYASYEITTGPVSGYSVFQNTTTPVAFPSGLSEFKAGIIYVLTYTGTALTLSSQLSTKTVSVPGNNLAMKLEWLKNNILSNTSYFIEITSDENIPPQTLGYSGESGIKITLSGSGANRNINLSEEGNLFIVESGVTLILNNNITLNGRNNPFNLISIDNGTLVMNAETKITNIGGRGVSVSSYGTFIMNGGEISGNTYSGVVTGGNFTMNSGKISNNTNNNDGGGVYVYGGTFTMNGGEISGNTATYDNGGGVYVSGGTFTMKGGEISGNYAKFYGGGVFVGSDNYYGIGTFRMCGGVIYGNNATADLKNTIFYNYGAALFKVSDSTAQYGIFIGSTFNKTGDLDTTDTTIRVVNGNLLTK